MRALILAACLALAGCGGCFPHCGVSDDPEVARYQQMKMLDYIYRPPPPQPTWGQMMGSQSHSTNCSPNGGGGFYCTGD